MKKSLRNPPGFSALRKQAEQYLEEKPAHLSLEISIEAKDRLIHELQVHQIELEMQNQELHKIQQALEVAHNKYCNLYDFAPVGYFTLNKDGVILEVNLTGADLLNVERNLLIGTSLSEFVMKEDRDILYLHHRHSQATQQKQICELRMLRNKKPFYAQLETVQAQDGNNRLFWTIITDISERRSADEALLRSEQRFELAMQGAKDGLWDWNLQTNEVYFSPRWKQTLGFTDNEIGNHINEWHKRIHSDDIEEVITKITNYLEKKIPVFENIHREQHKAGHYLWVLVRAIAVRNEQGTVTRMVGTQMDMTLQRQTEDALRQAKEAAEVANRAKSAFLANMSHELRTPLNGILGYAQILRRDSSLSEQQREGIQIVHRNGEYLLTLINDILDLSKMEADKVELHPTDIHIDIFLRRISDLFEERAKQKGISFYYQRLSQLPSILRADEKRLRQIIVNLLSNAVKFTEQGGVCFKVGYQNGKILLQVEDTGIGISQNQIAEVFLPFQRVAAQPYRYEGIGLGLSISKRLIEMMGGQLYLNSVLGQGSIFWTELELLAIHEPIKLPMDEEPIIIGYQIPPTFQKEGKKDCKILIADAQQQSSSLLARLLTTLGFSIVEARNGHDCINKTITRHPDIILLDVIMPIIDGFEVARRIRKIIDIQNTRIIAMSHSQFNYQQQEDVQFNDFIGKPVNIKQLLECLQKQLQLAWVYQTATIPTATERVVQAEDELPIFPMGPSAQQAAILFDLASIGDIRGIFDFMEQLGQENPELILFAREIHQLAKKFKIKKICEIAKLYMD